MKRIFSIMFALVLVLSLSLVMAVPAAANPGPELRAEITSPEEGDWIAPGSTFTVEVTVYNEGDSFAYYVDVACVLWPGLSFAAGEPTHGHKNLGTVWPPPGLEAGSSANLTWDVVCTSPGDTTIRINPSAMMHIGEADIVNIRQAYGVVEVSIDIKPGSDPNSINLKSKGVVPVAVLTTDDFDASTVDPETVLFAGAEPVRWTMEDVDSDGDMDMLFHFKTQNLTELDEDSTEATLIGYTYDGLNRLIGEDAVNIVPKGKGK